MNCILLFYVLIPLTCPSFCIVNSILYKISLYVHFLTVPVQTSKLINSKDAHALGLVDAIVLPDELTKTARMWALDISECRRPWVSSLLKTSKLEPLAEAREIIKFARAQVQKRAPNIKHPLVCIDVIEQGIISGPQAGLKKVSIPNINCFFQD